jgi:hypothetical protein
MPFLHASRLRSIDLDKITVATALDIYLPRSVEAAADPTNVAFVTFAGVGFEAPPLPC